MHLSHLESTAVKELAELFRSRYGAVQVCLYGSAAYGRMDESSDIDLFIVLPEVNWDIEKEIIRHCFDAELKYGRVFSAVCYSIDDLCDSPLKESPLVLNVKQHGLIL